MNEPVQAPPVVPPLLRRGMRLVELTIGYNVLEAVVALGAAWAAGSVALLGFGLDSVIETVCSVTVYHHLRAQARGLSEAEADAGERRALRVVGVTFQLLAAYVVYEAGSVLWRHEPPEESALGIALAAASMLAMPLLGLAKLRTGRALGSRALQADAKETLACAWLSVTLLAGLGLNAGLGWWWADPVAALAMLPWVVREGWEAMHASRCGLEEPCAEHPDGMA
jgi:divalent metal cation (Fe/Co/Zn/Cd) transporter